MDWRAFQECDAAVEDAIATGAYREALEMLVRGYQRVIMSYCRKRLGWVGAGGKAEEVAQEIFLTAYRIMPQKGSTPVRPWLFTVARLRCLREWSKDTLRNDLGQIHEKTITETAHQRRTETLEARMISATELDSMRASLAKLRKRDRELIEKRFLEGCSVAMMARELHWSETTVRTRLSTALRRLQTLYGRFQGES